MYSYEYDKLGQLVRYNDKVANKSYTYTYDNNGNILTNSEYAYTTGALGVATDTTTYSYEADWAEGVTQGTVLCASRKKIVKAMLKG